MDASRFDAWTRAIGTHSARRALLRGIARSAMALGAIGVLAETTDAKKDDKKKDDKKKKKCDKKTKQKCEKRGGRTCLDGKCVCDRCQGCLDICDGDDHCASFVRAEDGAVVCSYDVFGDCGECTTNTQCDTKYPELAGKLECVVYHGPICKTVQCAKGVARCAQRCGTQD
jgi:hypothetical protein